MTQSVLKILGSEPGLVMADGSKTLLPPGKPFAALCLMALEPGGINREQLATCLWSASPPQRARASVRQALHVVRKAVGDGGLIESGGHIDLGPDRVRVDVRDLDRALAEEDLERVHALWQGGPFSGFSLGDAPVFNDWADRIRGKYERRVAELLAVKAAIARNEGRADEALVWLGRALDVRPYDERTHLERVEILIELGLLQDAEHALDRARSVIDDPAPDLLDELQERLSRLRRSEPRAGGAPARFGLQFVGRTREMASLRTHWRSVQSGRPRTIDVLGDAGVGKSRLVTEFIQHAVTPGTGVVRVKAVDAERAIPLGLVADLAKELSARPGAAGISGASLSVLQQLVPSLGYGNGGPHVGSAADVSIGDAILDLVEAVGHESPLVILIEDLQWAEARSLGLILRTARSLGGGEVMTLVTCRSGDGDLTAVRALQGEIVAGRCDRIELRPLAADEVLETITLSLEVRPPVEVDRIATLLHRSTQGNPLFLAELMQHLQAEGVVHAENDHWVLEAERLHADLPLPASVRDILVKRILDVGDDHRWLLGSAAWRDRALTPEGLARDTGASEGEVQQSLAILLQRGILIRTGTDSLAFAHDSLREVARQEFGTPPRRAWPRSWRLAAGLAGALTVAAAWTGLSVAMATREPPLYPGIIYGAPDGEVVRYRLPSRRGDPWESLPPLPVPSGVIGAMMSLAGLDSVPTLGVVHSPMGRPQVVELVANGTRNLLPQDGDVNLQSMSPDGRYTLLAVADESSGVWRQRLVRMDLATGDTITLLAPPAGVVGARWFADGSAIAAFVVGPVDSIVWLRPDGHRLGAGPLNEPWSDPLATPCGPRHAVLSLHGADDGLHLASLTPATPELTDLGPIPAPVRSPPVCAPDGTAALFVADIDGRWRLLVQDLSTGDTLVGPPWPYRSPPHWRWASGAPVPMGVEVTEGTLRLEWGESTALRARVRLADGGHDSTVVWSSTNPAVASITSEGRAFANSPGEAMVVATSQGWLADTAWIVVPPSPRPPQALFADAFRSLDTLVWTAYGNPLPRLTVTADGDAVLDLNGDGVGADGIISREAFDLSRGGTLELSYRLPLTRRDRQSVQVCLNEGPSTSRAEALQHLCFTHPLGELLKFDSSTLLFSAGTVTPRIRRPDLFPSDDWRRVAIVLAPDGHARLMVEQKEVARLAFPIHNGPDVRWQINIYGRAADTHLLIRDLVLWEGMRY